MIFLSSIPAKSAMTRRCLIALFLLLGLSSGILAATAEELAKGFQNPPDSARPWVWWFWLNNNVSKQSITADLEELKDKGIGGVTVYSLAASRARWRRAGHS